ncbi:MAG: arsenate reductase ArsC [Marmoricola sp.]|nr:arsenate reductase ArsC [Marmoricola sp.]
MTSPTNEQHFARVVEDLASEFSSQFSPNLITSVVNRYRAELEPAATITDYLPVLVRRYAREDLLGQLKGRPLAV